MSLTTTARKLLDAFRAKPEPTVRRRRKPFTGEELRRLNAERGVGSVRNIDPALRATFTASPREYV